MQDIKKLKQKYHNQKNALKYAPRIDKLGTNIEFKLTFEEWFDIWETSGFLDKMGRGKDSYCMRRKNDIGHYEIGNVYIGSFGGNTTEGHKGLPKLKLKGKTPHNKKEWQDLKYETQCKLYSKKDPRVPEYWEPTKVRGTPENIKRMSDAQKGKRYSEEVNKKKGRSKTQEQKDALSEKMSIIMKQKWADLRSLT